MRRYNTSLALVVCAMLLVSAGLAQEASVSTVPNLIRYGGTLKDAQGAPLSSSTVGITFAIYNQQDGGAPVWMETQNVPTDAGGNYSVLLGSTTAIGLPSDLFSPQEQRWLGVQVQGQAEQPRVLLVSVPYAIKAHDAETLGGRSVSDFVLANSNFSSAQASAGSASQTVSGSTHPGQKAPASPLLTYGPTNFSGNTSSWIVGVAQSGTGGGLFASAPLSAVVGVATAASGTPTPYGVQGTAVSTEGVGVYGAANSTTGRNVGVKGESYSTSGFGVYGEATATSGGTIGVDGKIWSALGTAAIFDNAAGGKIISGQNNGTEMFSVDGLGNVSAAGTFEILSNGTGNSVLSIGQDPSDDNLWVGVKAGTGSDHPAGSDTGYNNVLAGANAGSDNTTGSQNTFLGTESGYHNTTGKFNTFLGYQTGNVNTTGSYNTFVGYYVGSNNVAGDSNVYIANEGPMSDESNTIRIGTQGTGNGQQSITYIAGISGGVTSNGTPVFVDSNGLLGTQGGTGLVTSFNGRMGAVVPASGDYSFSLLSGMLGGSQLSGTYSNAVTLSSSGNSFTGSGSGLTGIQFSQLSGMLGSSQLSGTYSNAVTLSNSGNSFTGSGSGLTGMQFSQLSGMLASSQLSGTYSNALTLSNTSNVYYGNGSNLMGVIPGSGSPWYIQNGTTQQSNAAFNIDGNGTVGGILSGLAVTSYTDYQIQGSPVLTLPDGLYGANLSVGYNTGYMASTTSNTFIGDFAGQSITSGNYNTFIGAGAGNSNSSGSTNIYVGNNAGRSNSTGSNNVYIASAGASGESNTIRIGSDSQQTAAYIAGIAENMIDCTSGDAVTYVVFDNSQNNRLGWYNDNCSNAGYSAHNQSASALVKMIETQGQQLQQQKEEIRQLKERLSRLELLVEERATGAQK